MRGNYSPRKTQRHHNLAGISDASQAVNTRNNINGSQSFYTLAESARVRHAVAPTRHHRHGPETSENALFSRPTRDNFMASHEHDTEIDSTRGRHPRAPMDEAHRHGDRNRHAREDEIFPSRMHSSRSRSPFKRNRSPDKSHPIPRSMTADSGLAEHRRNPRPVVIDIDTARQYGSVSKKAVVVESISQYQPQHGTVIRPNTPPNPLRRVPRTMSPSMSESDEGESSSYYSEEEFGQAHPSYVSPLRVRKDVDRNNHHHHNNNVVLRSQSTWSKPPSPEHTNERYLRSPQRLVNSRHCFPCSSFSPLRLVLCAN